MMFLYGQLRHTNERTQNVDSSIHTQLNLDTRILHPISIAHIPCFPTGRRGPHNYLRCGPSLLCGTYHDAEKYKATSFLDPRAELVGTPDVLGLVNTLGPKSSVLQFAAADDDFGAMACCSEYYVASLGTSDELGNPEKIFQRGIVTTLALTHSRCFY